MRTRSVLVAAAAVLMLSACADGAGGPDPTPSPPPGTASPSPPVVPSPPTLPPTGRPPVEPPPTSRTAEATLTGDVVSGVEAGCLLLQTGSGDYLLIGEAAAELGAGDTATVRGRVRPDLMSTCQQGTPFEVSEVVG